MKPLRVFDAVARAGSMARAAEALHITPGAVSQQIQTLEIHLGTPLFGTPGSLGALPGCSRCMGLGIAVAQLDYVAGVMRGGHLVRPLDLVARTEAGYHFICDPLKVGRYPVTVLRAWLRSVHT